MKLKKEHIQEEWNEGHPINCGDGYWIVLKKGWKWDGDPAGCLHVIHEDTKAKAYKEGVMPCTCRDCFPSR